MYASHIGFFFLLYCATGSPSLCSLQELLLPLSVCYSVGSKQVDWTWYIAPLKFGVSIPYSHRNAAGARQVPLPSSCADAAGLLFQGFKQIPAPGLCCTKKGQGPEPTRLSFIRKVSHLASKNSKGKGGETQLQARWEEAAVLPVC